MGLDAATRAVQGKQDAVVGMSQFSTPAAVHHMSQVIGGTDHSISMFLLDANRIGEQLASLDTLCTFIARYEPLRKLFLSNNGITDRGAQLLAQSLLAQGNIEKLALGRNEIGDAGVASICQLLLVEGSSLKSLDVAKNTAITSAGIQHLCTSMAESRLTSLSLCHVPLSASSCAAIGNVLALSHSPLKKLKLSGCKLGDRNLSIISKALLSNNRLEYLDVDFNGITCLGATALANDIASSRTLRYLTVRDNSISDAGAIALADTLERNQSLQQLVLENNKIGVRGVRALVHRLQQNRTLQHLFLGDEISEASVEILARATVSGSVVAELDIGDRSLLLDAINAFSVPRPGC